MKRQALKIWEILKETSLEWLGDDPFGKAAAVSYYAVFALPGLLLIIVTLFGLFYDEAATNSQNQDTLSTMIGLDAAKNITAIVDRIQQEEQSTLATLIGLGSLLFGATGLFIQLQKSLNEIWQVEKSGKIGLIVLLKDRATSLGVIIKICFLLLLSLIFSTLIPILNDWISGNFGSELYLIAASANIFISIVVTTLLFAAIFKMLPDVNIKWRMVWLGAFVTSMLFTVGKYLISFYLSHSDPGSSFGANSAIIFFLIWISYSSMILFFGAEFTQVYGMKYGYKIEAAKNAQRSASYEMEKRGNED